MVIGIICYINQNPKWCIVIISKNQRDITPNVEGSYCNLSYDFFFSLFKWLDLILIEYVYMHAWYIRF